MQKKLYVQAENIVVRFGEQKVLDFERFAVYQGERVGLVGRNGAGKTTLLRVLSGELEPDAGTVKMASLNLEKTVLQNVMEESLQTEGVARTVLARLLLSAGDMNKKAGVLSGGERIKLAFAKLFVGRANVLILDEPTNYLDIPSVEALESMFSEYEGVLIFVSHDERFIRACATEILEVKDGKTISCPVTPETGIDRL